MIQLMFIDNVLIVDLKKLKSNLNDFILMLVTLFRIYIFNNKFMSEIEYKLYFKEV